VWEDEAVVECEESSRKRQAWTRFILWLLGAESAWPSGPQAAKAIAAHPIVTVVSVVKVKEQEEVQELSLPLWDVE
jgi:hypothetical protein